MSGGGFGLCRVTTSCQVSSRCLLALFTFFTPRFFFNRMRTILCHTYWGWLLCPCWKCPTPLETTTLWRSTPTLWRSSFHHPLFSRIARRKRWRLYSTGVELGAQAGSRRARRRWCPSWNRTLFSWPNTFNLMTVLILRMDEQIWVNRIWNFRHNTSDQQWLAWPINLCWLMLKCSDWAPIIKAALICAHLESPPVYSKWSM